MSDHVIGIVAKITEKKAGAKGNLVYNICLDIDGEDEWFGHGFDEPIFNEDDEIEFDVSYNGDFANIDTDTVTVISEGEPKPKPKSRSSRSSGRSSGGSSRGGSSRSSGGSSRGGSSRSSKPAAKSKRSTPNDKPATLSKDEWADKDKMIRRQACMNTSIKLVGLLLAEGAVTIPKKKADAADAIVALCDEEAERLYDQYEEQVYGGGAKKRSSGRSENRYEDDIPE